MATSKKSAPAAKRTTSPGRRLGLLVFTSSPLRRVASVTFGAVAEMRSTIARKLPPSNRKYRPRVAVALHHQTPLQARQRCGRTLPLQPSAARRGSILPRDGTAPVLFALTASIRGSADLDDLPLYRSRCENDIKYSLGLCLKPFRSPRCDSYSTASARRTFPCCYFDVVGRTDPPIIPVSFARVRLAPSFVYEFEV
jgi:hypothetical protein